MVINEVEFLGRKSVKIESDESQSEDNSNSGSEISLEKIRTDVFSSFIKSKKRRLEGSVRPTSSGKIYVEEMHSQDTSINQTNQPPFDIEDNCIFEVPINTEKRSDSIKDGRHWGPKQILYLMMQKCKELSEVESKADQMLDRVILSKIRTTSKANTDFSKLIELKERYKKDDPFLNIQVKIIGI